MIVDYHSHYMLRSHFGPEIARQWDARGGTGAWPDHPPEEFDRAMEPVDRAIVFGITAHALGIHTPSGFIADFVRRRPEKYIGFMALDPSVPDAVEQMEHGVKLGLRGIKIYPVMSLYRISDPRFHPFFRKAIQFGLPVLTHMGASPMTEAPLKYSQPIDVDDLAIALPELRVIMAHLGHPWQRDCALVARKHENVWADISGVWHRPWQGYEALIVCQEWGVMHKLLFGSDFPLWTPAGAIEALYKLNDQVEGTPLPRISRDALDELIHRDALAPLGLA